MGMKWYPIPSMPEQTESRQYLLDLMRQKLEIPARKVPGLTAEQQSGQEWLREYLAQPATPALSEATNYLRKTLAGEYDPRTSPYYQSFREQSLSDEERAANILRQRLNIAQPGAVTTAPARSQEINLRRGFATDRLGALGSLYEAERGRMQEAAGMLPGAAQLQAEEPLRKAQAGTLVGEAPRAIEAEQEEALWEALKETLLGPYMYQAPLAQALIGEPRYVGVQKSEKSSGWGGIAGSVLSALL